MRILLLQDEIHLPSFAGGIKANRLLLEGLAGKGHECLLLSRALSASADGAASPAEFMADMAARGIEVRSGQPDVFAYDYGGVRVEALNFADQQRRAAYGAERIGQFAPDWVLVADDKRRFMLGAAIGAAADRTVLLLQTIVQLPFGPLAVQANRRQTELMAAARAVVVISHYMQRYIGRYSRLQAHVQRLPVYGTGPFRSLACFDSGYVTMINPCQLKGGSLFLALVREHARYEFAAVPTWGIDAAMLQEMAALPNLRLLAAADEIETILAQTRVLLVPSLWPETFGYVVLEAMLRGIPVLASDLGGLPEAKLGVDYLLPVAPAERRGDTYVYPPQDIAPWSEALCGLLDNQATYARCARASRKAATEFVAGIGVSAFETFLASLA